MLVVLGVLRQYDLSGLEDNANEVRICMRNETQEVLEICSVTKLLKNCHFRALQVGVDESNTGPWNALDAMIRMRNETQ